MRKSAAALLIAMMLMFSIYVEAYIIVLKNGRKIFSPKPFEFKEDGVYFSLPNDMLIFIKKDDIDFKATEEINKPKRAIPSNKTPEKIQTGNTSGEHAERQAANTARENTSEIQPPPPQVSTETVKPAQETQSSQIQTQSKKPQENNVKPSETAVKPPVKPKSETKKTDFGISVESIDKTSITLDQLIEMARKVEWIYEGKCPICGGTGKSPLSTSSVELVCTYCNGTGKGGKWNDDQLKIGDDCPWCVLGYDELSKGPCKNCLGTGRYLGLDKLPIFEIYDNKGSSKSTAATGLKSGKKEKQR